MTDLHLPESTDPHRLASTALDRQLALAVMYPLLARRPRIDQPLLSHLLYPCADYRRQCDHILPTASLHLLRSHLPSTQVWDRGIHVYDSSLEAVEKFRLVAKQSLCVETRHHPRIRREGYLPSASIRQITFNPENAQTREARSTPSIFSINRYPAYPLLHL